MTGIDRDHLAGVIAGYLMQDDTVPDDAPIVHWSRGPTDMILALVQPVAGITLTPEEAQTAAEGCTAVLSEFEGAWPERHLARFRSLADRLEASA